MIGNLLYLNIKRSESRCRTGINAHTNINGRTEQCNVVFYVEQNSLTANTKGIHLLNERKYFNLRHFNGQNAT